MIYHHVLLYMNILDHFPYLHILFELFYKLYKHLNQLLQYPKQYQAKVSMYIL